MFPALKMHGNDNRFIKKPGYFKTFLNGHGQMSRANLFYYCCPQEKKHHTNIKSFCNFFDTFIPNGVAGNINRTLRFVFKIQYKACYGTAVAANGPMAARSSCYCQNAIILSWYFNCLPV